jgi:hypothetical protein
MPEKQFGAPSLDKIGKGALAKKLQEQIEAAAKALAAYVLEGGVDMTKKAKASVALKIDIVHVEAGVFTIRGDVAMKAPSGPMPTTDRLVLDEQTGGLVMPLAPELTQRDDPRQRTFAMVSDSHDSHDPNRKKEL